MEIAVTIDVGEIEPGGELKHRIGTPALILIFHEDIDSLSSSAIMKKLDEGLDDVFRQTKRLIINYLRNGGK